MKEGSTVAAWAVVDDAARHRTSSEFGATSWSEWRWVLWVALGVVVLAALPFLYAWWKTPPGMVYTGFLVNPLDGHSYLAKMRQGATGHWLFALPFTTESHWGALLFTYYLFLGHLSAWLALPPMVVYHVARSLAGIMLLLAVYRFVTFFVADVAARRLTFAVVALSSGLGWLVAPMGVVAPDLWVPEAGTFYSIFANPHFPLAEALMLTLFLAIAAPFGWPSEDLARLPERGGGLGLGRVVLSAAASLALAVVQPFSVPVVYLVAGAYLTLQGVLGRQWPVAQWRRLVISGVAAAPALGYYYLVYRGGSLAAWSVHYVAPAPSPPLLLVTYGLLWPLAVAGAVHCVRTGRAGAAASRRGVFLVAWLALNLALLYSPVDLQRRLLIGLHLPVAILASIGLVQYVWPLVARRRVAVSVGAVTLLALSNVLLLLVGFAGPAKHEWPLFMTGGERDALVWLRDQTAATDVVLASPETGLFIPAWAGNRVIYGHPYETVDAARKRAELESVFRGQAAPADVIRAYGVRYIFVGPNERAYGGLAGLAAEVGSAVVYSNSDVTISQVAPGG